MSAAEFKIDSSSDGMMIAAGSVAATTIGWNAILGLLFIGQRTIAYFGQLHDDSLDPWPFENFINLAGSSSVGVILATVATLMIVGTFITNQESEFEKRQRQKEEEEASGAKIPPGWEPTEFVMIHRKTYEGRNEERRKLRDERDHHIGMADEAVNRSVELELEVSRLERALKSAEEGILQRLSEEFHKLELPVHSMGSEGELSGAELQQLVDLSYRLANFGPDHQVRAAIGDTETAIEVAGSDEAVEAGSE